MQCLDGSKTKQRSGVLEVGGRGVGVGVEREGWRGGGWSGGVWREWVWEGIREVEGWVEG